MTDISISIPDEVNELASASKIDWQRAVVQRVKEEIEEVSRIKRIISKSKMTQKQADTLSDEINLSLAKRYEKLLKGE